MRMRGLIQLPVGFNASVTYFYGSGNRFNDSIATALFGKPGPNRLNLSATGTSAGSITIPASKLDRWNGPAVIAPVDVIPRDALHGLPLHKAGLHATEHLTLIRD